MAVGGRGVISVASNEAPRQMSQMVEAAERGDFAAARRIHAALLPLMLVNFVESNPIPVKAAMAAMGLLDEVFRLPMVPPRAGIAREDRGRAQRNGSCERRVSQGERVSDSTVSQLAPGHRAALSAGRVGGQEREPDGVRDASRGAVGWARARGRAGRVGADGLARQYVGQAGNPRRVPLRRSRSTCRSRAAGSSPTRTRCRSRR